MPTLLSGFGVNLDITYLGTGGVKLSGKQTTILCDPPGAKEGKVKGGVDVVLVSGTDKPAQSDGAMVIDGPGEYEVKGALITGVPVRLHIDAEGERGTSFGIKVDGINIVFVGNISGPLSDSHIEALGQVDVLVVPVGGHGLTLDATAAAQVISQLEPKYVIPTHYEDGVSKYEMPQDGVEKFMNEMGVKPEPVSKLKVQAKELPDETTVVVLESASA
jgi:L-ascorbate metabolism protein UlaG (beta-lactamase superfamily)